MIFLYEILCIFKIRIYFNIYAKYADNFQLSSAFATGKSYYVKYSRYTNVAKRINQPHTHMHQDTCDRNIKPEWCIILTQFERLVKKGTRLKYLFFTIYTTFVFECLCEFVGEFAFMYQCWFLTEIAIWEYVTDDVAYI